METTPTNVLRLESTMRSLQHTVDILAEMTDCGWNDRGEHQQELCTAYEDAYSASVVLHELLLKIKG